MPTSGKRRWLLVFHFCLPTTHSWLLYAKNRAYARNNFEYVRKRTMNHKALFIVFIVLPLGLGHAVYGQSFQIANVSLGAALSWLSTNAVEGGSYTVTLGQNETVGWEVFSYNGKKVTITLLSGASERVISSSSGGFIFTVNKGATLTLGNNITVRNGGIQIMGGTLVMNTGSKAGGNSKGNGVSISGGTFTMNGGIISGNSTSESYAVGGGVYVDDGGTFTKQSGGTIYGSNASGSLRNTAGSGYGHAVFIADDYKRRNTTAGSGVTLNSGRSGSAGGWE
jgi:hypothetical protein